MDNRTGTPSVEPFDNLPSNSDLLKNLEIPAANSKRQWMPIFPFIALTSILVAGLTLIGRYCPNSRVYLPTVTMWLFWPLVICFAYYSLRDPAKTLLAPVETFASHLDIKTVLEDAPVRRLIRIPEEVLQERKKRIDLKIKFTKNTGSVALMVSALIALAQLFLAIHSTSTTPMHSIPVCNGPLGSYMIATVSAIQPSRDNGTSPYVFLIALLVGVVIGWHLLVHVSRHLERIAHVLKRARKERIRLNNRWLV